MNAEILKEQRDLSRTRANSLALYASSLVGYSPSLRSGLREQNDSLFGALIESDKIMVVFGRDVLVDPALQRIKRAFHSGSFPGKRPV